jgi:hypothetical protein
MNRLYYVLFSITLYWGAASGQAVVSKDIMGSSFASNEFSIMAKSDTVWGKLNTPTTLSDVMGMKLRGGAMKLADVGSAANMVTEHDTGSVIMTYRKGRGEIRFIFDPDSGTYLFQDIWKLRQVGANQTKVLFERRYVRPIPITSSQISGIVQFLNERLARLKEMAEKSK